jgi:hypothetical protein
MIIENMSSMPDFDLGRDSAGGEIAKTSRVVIVDDDPVMRQMVAIGDDDGRDVGAHADGPHDVIAGSEALREKARVNADPQKGEPRRHVLMLSIAGRAEIEEAVPLWQGA